MTFLRFIQFLVIFLVVFVSFKIFRIYQKTGRYTYHDSDLESTLLVSNKTEIFENWRFCAKLKLQPLEDPVEFWRDFVNLTGKCDEEAQVYKLGLVDLEGFDKQKTVILPKSDDENHNLITLGIGSDISGEQAYQRKMQKLNKQVNFFGADPLVDPNSEIYSKIGKFFPFAVARHPGFSNSTIERNGQVFDQNLAHVDVLYFLKDILSVEKVDNLWINAEGAEYELFEIFEKNGVLDQNNIEICQVNMEIHISQALEGEENPNLEKQKIFMEFVKKLIAEKKYGIFRTAEKSNIKVYMFNFESEYCKNKF